MLYKISTADVDFIPLTSTIQYNPSMAEQEILVCESIQIENDNLSEDIENFTVLLNTTEPSVSFMIQSAVVAIADDDSKYDLFNYAFPLHNTLFNGKDSIIGKPAAV